MARVTLTMAQNGETVAVKAGDTLALQLPENPSSGYRWAFDRLDEALLAVEDSSYRSDMEQLGSGGVASWILSARAPGKTRLGLKCWRHWEGDRSVIERFSVMLTID